MFQAVMHNKNVMAIIHRRAGKDIGCLQLWVLRGLQRVGTHVYLFPLYSQARSVIWHGLDFDGKPFMDNIPLSLIAKKNEARMELTLINGSRLILAGSNNTDSLMGTNPITIIYSEFALHHPMARPYLNPILLQNGGIEIIQSTPRGRNHCWELFELVKNNPAYHVEHLSIEQTFKHDGTHIFTKKNLDDARKMGMSDEMIAQELFCSFDSGNVGAYFTKEMTDMEREGRLLPIKPNSNLTLHTVWDLGGVDSTCAWIFQTDGQHIYMLAMLTDTGKGLKHYLDLAEKLRQEWGCHWGFHFGPHDIAQKHQSWEQAESRLTLARRAGWNFQVTPKLSVEDGIEAMRFILPKVKIDSVNCQLGIRALREYQRQYSESRAIFEQKPLHNWASHIADSFRYLSINYRRLFDTPIPPRTYQYHDQNGEFQNQDHGGTIRYD